MNRRHISSALVLFVTVALIVGCSGGTDGASTFGQYDAQPVRGEVRVVHVHGLGINPKDGSLYAATHTGLFLIRADGTAERVGQSYQDTMGFTVVGPDQFLGSGHPDLRDYQAGRWPPLLGLISSDDAGKNWKSVSLKGEADFHSLKIARQQVYGFDSTGEAFMVSKDGGKSWDTRSKLALIDFAVSPTNADSVIGTTGRGLLKSNDGGKTWQPSGAQIMMLVAWPEAARLWGLDARGGVHLSDDGGTTWRPQGSLPGAPEAFLDAGSSLYAAVREQGIFQSQDGGKTWRAFYRDPV